MRFSKGDAKEKIVAFNEYIRKEESLRINQLKISSRYKTRIGKKEGRRNNKDKNRN